MGSKSVKFQFSNGECQFHRKQAFQGFHLQNQNVRLRRAVGGLVQELLCFVLFRFYLRNEGKLLFLLYMII